MNIARATAWLISGLFHPLLLGCLLPSSLLFLEQAVQGVSYWASGQALLWTGMFVVPALLLLMLKKQGRVQSLMLHIREERNVVYVISFLWFFIFTAMMQLLSAFGAQSGVYGLLWLNTLSALILWQVNARFHKVSAHATAGSALMVYLAFIFPWKEWIIAMILIFLLVVAARAVLKAHSMAELISGTVCGALAAALVLWLR
ncbi:MAG: hypothetical protein KJS92_00250 [Bacteroidetes bacterium]|nr:hypothetical protein [Bacteroidota bacterium]